MFTAYAYTRDGSSEGFAIVRDTDSELVWYRGNTAREWRDADLAALREDRLTWADVTRYASRADGTNRDGGYRLTAVGWQGTWEAEAAPLTPDEEVTRDFRAATDEQRAKLRALIVARNEADRLLATEREARRQEREQLTATVQRLSAEITDVSDDRLTPIWDKAAEAAEEAGFCPEYDKLCSILGVPGRERTYRGVVTVTLNAYVYTTSRGEEEAAEEMENLMRAQVESSLAVGDRYYPEPGSITVVEVQETEAEEVSIYS